MVGLGVEVGCEGFMGEKKARALRALSNVQGNYSARMFTGFDNRCCTPSYGFHHSRPPSLLQPM